MKKKYYYFIIFIVIVLLYKKLEGLDNSINYDDYIIVCAKYNKNTDFLNDTPIPSIVLEKGDGPGQVINKANETTSYLYYIIHNYDSLPPHIIFIHDEDESWHHDGKITGNIEKWIQEYIEKGSTYYNFNNRQQGFDEIDLENGCLRKKGENVETPFWIPGFKDLYDNTMKPYNIPLRKSNPSACCAQFIVSRDVIRSHPKEMYEKMYSWYENKTNSLGNGDPGHNYSGYNTSRYAEWAWYYLFDVNDNSLPNNIKTIGE
jgi:hypothetical protein